MVERLEELKDAISIHALLTESDDVFPERIRVVKRISIHALLTESDDSGQLQGEFRQISIHALLTESDKSGRCEV